MKGESPVATLPGKPSALVKPTLDTKFHIDFDWWERSPDDLRIYMLSHLLPEQRERLNQHSGEERTVDYIDPVTGEVFQFDELRLAIRLAAETPGFINEQTSVVDNIFRALIMHNNTPMTPTELAKLIKRPAETILRTLNGKRIYKGIRPILS
jgi:hypothetical protein